MREDSPVMWYNISGKMKLCASVVVLLFSTASAFYSASDGVVNLTPSNFQSEVTNSPDFWIVEFYAPWCGHCKSLAPEWKKAAKALQGIVKVGAADVDEHKSLGSQFGIQGFPTIKIFGGNKASPEDYKGGRTWEAIVDAVLGQLGKFAKSRVSGGGKSGGGGSSGGGSGGGKKPGPGNPGDVIELTDSNFESTVLESSELWMVEFFAPWCGHCKSLAPEWASAATQMKGKVMFGALDATVHTVIASRYGIRGFPSIKLFQNGEASDYDGGRQASDLITWATDKKGANIPPPELTQVTSEEKLKENCEDHPLCIISIFPHILDCQSKCRNNYIGLLTKLADKYKKNQWGWLWAEAGAQPELESALGIGGFGYPATAALNARKMMFALQRGAFSDEGLNEFLRELSYGRGSTAPLKNAKLPEISTGDPWDGKDGELPEEEDIDLSDIDLDDLDSDGKDEL